MEEDKEKHRQTKKIAEFRVNFNPKNLFLWLFIFILGISFFLSFQQGARFLEEKPLSTVINDVRDGKVGKIEVEGDRLVVHYRDGKSASTHKESQESLIKILETTGVDSKGVEIQVKDSEVAAAWWNFLSTVLPLILMVAFFFFIFRQARGAQDTIFSFGQSRARLFSKDVSRVTFADVAGVDEAKQELSEVVDFLKHPGKYRSLGARTPKGALLVGPSGTGKTLLAKAMAGEANVPFFSMAGSEFMEMLVGVGASRVRDLFATAKKNAPSIIFIDEIDAIGRMRAVGVMGGHDEREQTLNQILVEMDGFTPNENVLVVAASVTGETSILVKDDDKVRLVPIGEFVDQYFPDSEKEGEVEVDNVFCLGLEKLATLYKYQKNLFFGGSAFKPVKSVFRHRVKEIYEIEYLGGEIRATGNHSVFVRSPKGIETKAVADLQKGDILVDLPYKVNRTKKELMRVRAHRFERDWLLDLPIFDPEIEQEWQGKYLFATQNENGLSQSQIAQMLEVSQETVSYWQREIGSPRPISRNYFKSKLPEKIKVTPGLCRLLGYYVAEGYARWEVDFCFSVKESEKVEDLVALMEENFGIKPDRIRRQTAGAVNVIYSAAPLAKFFINYCGKGAANKHIPSFLFEAPYEYFLEFLRGVWQGDGYEDKRGRGEITSVSKRLILELNWLCRMHGIKTYVGGFVAKEGRTIKGGKPLAAVRAYRLGWGKANNPFAKHSLEKTYPIKRAIVKKVSKVPFKGFVYDLCGVENEAFFGGESPVLLHNTNRGDLLDPALLRPGRFDRRVVLDMPDIEGRKAILAIHMKGKPFTPEVDWDKMARRTVGFSGADLENMLNEAAILAARLGKKSIDMEDLEEAATKVKLGPEKKRIQSDLDKRMTAYHEAGHAIVTHELPHMDPVHRISIVSRGLALGFTLIPPVKDRYTETRSHLLEQVTSLLGGRAAEELVFQEFTAGAASDISKATEIARTMVVEYGMSDLGPVNLGPNLSVSEIGRVWYEPTQVSPQMQSKIDAEIKKIIDNCYKNALEILKNLKEKLGLVGEKLMKKETIEGEEFEKLMGAKNVAPAPALA